MRHSEHHLQPRILSYLAIILLRDRRGSSHHILKIRKSLGSLYHQREIILYLPLARTGKESDDRLVVRQSLPFLEMSAWRDMLHRIGNLLHRGIPYICHIIIMSVLIECHFKGKDGIELIHIFLYLLHSPFFPCPNFRRDKIMHRNPLLRSILRKLEIESRIIHQDKSVGAISVKKILGLLKIAP